MNGRDRLLGLIDGRSTDRLPCLPITMMFASDLAGAKYSDYATDYRVQAAAQLDIAESFDFDHVSVISDPCCEAADCGAEILFTSDLPPAVSEEHSLLREKGDLLSLQVPDPHSGPRMSNRLLAVEELATSIGGERLVEGWVEGPCAEAADLRGINRIMLDFYDDPAFVRDLVDFIVEMEVAFGAAQVEAGADIIGIGDAAASLVGPKIYGEFIWPAEKRIVDALHALGTRVRLHICGNSAELLPAMGQLGCEIVDVDSVVPMSHARASVGAGQALCGNIDPVRVMLNGTPSSIHAALAACHGEAGDRYVVGAGCEIPRGTPMQNVRALVEYARASPD
jgi:MtaA/CmuA family methyltransferase